MPQPVEAVIFDLGRVLIDVDFTRGLFRRIATDSREDNLVLIEALFHEELFVAYSSGKISTETLYNGISEKFNLHIPRARFEEEWCDIFTPVDGMKEVLERVQKNHPVGLLSDTDPLHWNYCIGHFPWLKSIEKPTLSYEIGYLKPHPRCYQIAAANVGFPADRCLFIDDRPKNVNGAIDGGMQAIRFESAEQIKGELKRRNIL